MKYIACISFIWLSFIAPAAPAEELQEVSKPATKLEAFQAKTGVVIIRGFTTIGTVGGMGSVTVDAREFRDASAPTVSTTGISVAVRESGRLERENTAFIDSDEIASLLAGIDYIAKTSASVTTLSQFEVEYRTKGEFRVIVFNDSSGKLSVAVSAGRVGRTSAYLSIAQLQDLRALIVAAKEKIAG